MNDVSAIPAGQECVYEFAAGEIAYWARLSGFGGTFEELIANGAPDCQPTVVAIRGNDTGFEWLDACW